MLQSLSILLSCLKLSLVLVFLDGITGFYRMVGEGTALRLLWWYFCLRIAREHTENTSLYIAGRLRRVFLATKSMKLHERPCALCASLAPLALKVFNHGTLGTHGRKVLGVRP